MVQIIKNNGFVPVADVQVLLATSTGKKRFEKNAIARARAAEYGIRGRFDLLSFYALHHSAVEDAGSRDLNAALKLEDSSSEFNTLRPGGSLHNWFADRQVAEGMLRKGREFDERRYIHAVDDSTIGMPWEVWKYCAEELSYSQLVSARLLEVDSHIYDGKNYVSVQEIGRLIGAVGEEAFWNIVHRAAQHAGRGRDVILTDQITCFATRMSDQPGSPPHKIDKEVPFLLRRPKNENRSSERLLLSEEHKIPIDGNKLPASQRYASYLLSPHNARRLVVDGLMKFAAEGLQRGNVVGFRLSAAQNLKPTNPPKHKRRNLLIVQPAGNVSAVDDKEVDKLGKLTIRKITYPTKSPEDIRSLIAACSMEFYFGRKQEEHADGVFLPPLPKDPGERTETILTFKNAMVAKSTDPRYLPVPVIIKNLGGSWDSVLHSRDAGTNLGFNKNIPLDPILRDGKALIDVPGVRHRSTLGYEELIGDDEYAMNRAVKKLVEQFCEGYVRLDLPGQFDPQITSGGVEMPKGLTAVLGCASASSEYRPLYDDASRYMRFVAENGMAMVWGGGDRVDTTMEALLRGYREGDGPWHMAVSTHGLVQVECMTKRLPEGCSAWQLSRAIGPRMATLFTGAPDLSGKHKRYFNGADIVPYFGGGDGTGAEILLPMVWEMKDRFFIHYIPEHSSRGMLLIDAIDPKMGARLRHDHYALADQGRLLATNMDEFKKMTLEAEQEINKRKREAKREHDWKRQAERAPPQFARA